MSDALVMAVIRANVAYEKSARRLEQSRDFMLFAKDKTSRKDFQSALVALTEAHHEKSKLESALLDFCREQAINQGI